MRRKFSRVKPPTSSEPGMKVRKLYCSTSPRAARKSPAASSEGSRKARKNGRRRGTLCFKIAPLPASSRALASPRSMHHVLGEPVLPDRQELRPRLVIDDDRLRLPLLGRREDAGQLRQRRVDLRMHVHRPAAVEIAELRLNRRVERDVDEFVRGGAVLGSLRDADGVDADDGAFLGNGDD